MPRLMVGTVATVAIAACFAIAPNSALAKDKLVIQRNAATTFATLPDGMRHPEGLAADPATGALYVGTFDFGATNWLLRYDRNGKLAAQRSFDGTPLLGLAFQAGPSRDKDKVYIANFGASQIQRISAAFDNATVVETVAIVPSIGAPPPRTVPNPDGSSDLVQFGSAGFPSPNALAFRGPDLYVSDSFQGAIFAIRNAATCATPCPVETISQDPLLATAGFPPFGANGLAFSGQNTLFVANTGDDRVLTVDLVTRNVSVFAESLNGADGIAFDDSGRLWVAANQADEVVALNETGRVVAVLGEFKGLNANGTPDGLLFPASLALVNGEMFVTNLALPLAGGDEPEADVTRFTISRMKIPNRR